VPAVTTTTDQAASLRKLVSASKTTTVPRKGRVISVTSGKGGVGKTNISINLAYALASMGRRVYLLDADLGLANIDVLLNLTPAYTIDDVLSGEMELRDIIADGPGNIKVLPSSSGVVEMAELDEDRQAHLLEKLKDLDDDMDYLIIDTGAGIAGNVLRFSVCADEIILVVAAEPSSMTDAYSVIKVMASRYDIRSFNLLANSLESPKQGERVFEHLQKVSRDFLQLELNYLGGIPRDPKLIKAVRSQRPLLEMFPDSPAAKSIKALAQHIETSASLPRSLAETPRSDKSLRFWERILQWREKKN
jgi:flagellar biosynthesis protein FlhG